MVIKRSVHTTAGLCLLRRSHCSSPAKEAMTSKASKGAEHGDWVGSLGSTSPAMDSLIRSLLTPIPCHSPFPLSIPFLFLKGRLRISFHFLSASPLSMAFFHPQFLDIFPYILFFSDLGVNFCEGSFWNYDALFQPQQHPARDAHDTFFLTGAASILESSPTKTADPKTPDS